MLVYTNSRAYDAFDGLDLLPQARGKFVFDAAYASAERHYLTATAARAIASVDGTLRAGFCTTPSRRILRAAQPSAAATPADTAPADTAPAAAAPAAATGATAAAIAAAAPTAADDDDDEARLLDSGSWWAVQRLGSLRSHGGGAWFQFGWSDVGGLTGRGLEAAIWTGVATGVSAHVATPVDNAGAPISQPPLHVHHARLVPGGGSYRTWGNWHCLLQPSSPLCFSLSQLADAAGDAREAPSDAPHTSGGPGSSYVYGGRAFTKAIEQSLALNAEVRDVRPEGSPPIDWAFEVALRVQRLGPMRAHAAGATGAPGEGSRVRTAAQADMGDGAVGDVATDEMRALSTHTAHGPLFFCPAQLGCITQAVRVPAHTESFHFYTGRMPAGGTLVAAHRASSPSSQSHLSAVSLLFGASPQQLGFPAPPRSPFFSQEADRFFGLLHRPPLWPRMVYQPMVPGEHGFDHNEALLYHVLTALAANGVTRRTKTQGTAASDTAGGAADAAGDAAADAADGAAGDAALPGATSAGSWADPYPSARAQLVCESGLGSAGGVASSHVRCNAWRFARLQQYTVVTAYSPRTKVPTAAPPTGQDAATDGGSFIFARDAWVLDYVADDAHSRYTIDLGSVVPDAIANTTADGKSLYRENLAHLYLYRGTPPYSATLYTHVLYALLVAQRLLGEFQAMLFLPPRLWGVFPPTGGGGAEGPAPGGGDLLLTLAALVPLMCFVVAVPLLFVLYIRVLVTREAYSLAPATSADANGFAGEAAAASVEGAPPNAAAEGAPPNTAAARAAEAVEAQAEEVVEVGPLDHGWRRLRADLPGIGKLVATTLVLYLLFAGWGGYEHLYLVGVLGPSISLDLLPFLTYFWGYVVAYWTEGYAIRTGRIKPLISAATALSFPELGRYPVVPFALFLGGAAQLIGVQQFALLRLMGATRMSVLAYCVYKPVVGAVTIGFNSIVVYYVTAIRACRYAYLAQGKHIPVLASAARAARQHRIVLYMFSLVATAAYTAVFGCLLGYAAGLAPSDAVGGIARFAREAAPRSVRVVPLPLVIVDVVSSTFLIPYTCNFAAAKLCAVMLRSGRIECVPDGALINTGVFGWHHERTSRRGLYWSGCCVALLALPNVGWLVLMGARQAPAMDYLWWKVAYTLLVSLIATPRAVWWGLAAASLVLRDERDPEDARARVEDQRRLRLRKARRAVCGSATVGREEHSHRYVPLIETGNAEDSPHQRRELAATGGRGSPAIGERFRGGTCSPLGARHDVLDASEPGAAASSLREDGTQSWQTPGDDGSPPSCWSDACSWVLCLLAALAVLSKLEASARLLVPDVVEHGGWPAVVRAFDAAWTNGGPPRNAAMMVIVYDQLCMGMLLIGCGALMTGASRWAVLLLQLGSPASGLAIVLLRWYPGGVERPLDARGAGHHVAAISIESLQAMENMKRICLVVGSIAAMLPYFTAASWIASHGHLNYMDALAEARENDYAAAVRQDDVLRCMVGVISLFLAFRYAPSSGWVWQPLMDVLPLKSWMLPALVFVYATPTAATACSLWFHLKHMQQRHYGPSLAQRSTPSPPMPAQLLGEASQAQLPTRKAPPEPQPTSDQGLQRQTRPRAPTAVSGYI